MNRGGTIQRGAVADNHERTPRGTTVARSAEGDAFPVGFPGIRQNDAIARLRQQQSSGDGPAGTPSGLAGHGRTTQVIVVAADVVDENVPGGSRGIKHSDRENAEQEGSRSEGARHGNLGYRLKVHVIRGKMHSLSLYSRARVDSRIRPIGGEIRDASGAARPYNLQQRYSGTRFL